MQFVWHLKVGPYRGEIQYQTNIGLKRLLCEKKGLAVLQAACPGTVQVEAAGVKKSE